MKSKIEDYGDKDGLNIREGVRFWKKNRRLHREDGPAIEYDSGTKLWYINGQLHRLDGPASEYCDGDKPEKIWYYKGNRVDVESQKEFEQWLKYKTFL